MFLDAAVLATLAGISIIYLSDRIPPRIKAFFKRNNIAADAVAFLVAYTLFGGTIAAVLAGVLLVGVMEAILLVANNPDDFLYLWDFKRSIEEHLAAARDHLKQFNEDYRSRSITVLEGSKAS